ncbi:MAG: transglutaminase domain-containing protein [Candidatus Omnitrophota bacterium]|nr:transglutaminase domain-containing protein [Candidatus Omnitrophota bacterium]
MEYLTGRKFDEWTSGLSPEEGRIRIFEEIRDIPYFIDLEMLDREKGPVKMLEVNRGSCSPKHYLLGSMYRMLGLSVRFCTYPFLWKEMDVGYPAELREMADELPVTYHLACRVLIKGKWVLVDATWDSALREAAFPVNLEWDGNSDTFLAVNPLDEIAFEDVREREKALKEKMNSYGLPEKLKLSRFTMGLNKWLEKVRELGSVR